MASLKNIMNTDDEHVDPQSGSRSIDSASRPSLRPNPSASGRSYAISLDQSTLSAPHINRADPPRPLTISSVADLSSSSNTNQAMNSRRPSSTSIDSIEFPHGSSQQVSSSSNTPMSPFTAGVGSGEPHVKLTPITRKISKAKKGVRVHVCNQCPKTFSRAEHLRRHQLSHSDPGLSCEVPGCNKTFYRKDLLDRHLQRHEQDNKGPKDVKQATARRNSKAPAPPCTSTTRETGLQMPEGFNDPRMTTIAGSSNNSTMVSGPWQSMTAASSVSQSYTTPTNMTGPTEDYSMSGVTDYVLGPTTLQTTNDTFVSTYSEPRAMPELSMLAIPETGTPDIRWRDSSGMASSASESTFSTPSDNTRQHHFPIRTSSGDWINPITSYQSTSSDLRTSNMENGGFSVPFTYSNSPPQIYQPAFGDSMGLPLPGYPESNTFSTTGQIPSSTVRSMSPPLAVAQSETLVAVPSLPASDRAFNLAGCGPQHPDGGGLLTAENLMPVSLSPAASEAVPAYLRVYWDKVHPTYPIIHKHSFGDTSEATAPEHVEVLRCAMAAVATQYLAGTDDRMRGAQLHAYAWYKSKVFTQADEWPLPVKQTVMLCEYYALDNVAGIRIDNVHIAKLFPGSAVANTYLALHHTPLYCLLSVSGDSWVFNKKVTELSAFAEHQKLVEQWRGSGTAAIATVFAARALKAFLGLGTQSTEVEGCEAEAGRPRKAPWADISDYWGIYVCALICWAFGHTDKRDTCTEAVSRELATQWIVAVAEMEPADVVGLAQRHEARGVVSLAREELAAECLGGRNILFADAVGVLKKLERKTT
ncbi:hypothetical protein ACJ41O_004934 [Fusarium nematophilum]